MTNASRTINEYTNKLKESMDIFLAPFEHYGHITRAITNLEEVFYTITGLNPFSRPPEYDGESQTEQGVAIAPNFAGMCVREFMRTWYFLKGMYMGIKTAGASFPGECIRVLYAGCGPFATLFIPLTTCFSPREMRFTLLDIHPQSIESVKKLIAALDISDYIDDCLVIDALRFSPPPGKTYHLAVTETMNQALRKEPQVAITHHIRRFLVSSPKSIFIPQRVTVSAVVTDYDNEFPGLAASSPAKNGVDTNFNNGFHPHIDLGIVYELIPGMENYPEKTFQIPPLKNRNNILALLTTITVFDDLELTEGQCSLTLPYRFGLLHQLPAASGDRYTAFYEISSLPAVRIKPNPGP
jgi:hypothetical protein